MSENRFSAGWYPDPENGRQQRYWDGSGWTAHTAPQGHSPNATQPLPIAREDNAFPRQGGTEPAKKPFWKRKWVLVGAGAVAALALISNLASQDEKGTAAASQPTTSTSTSAPSTTQSTSAAVTTAPPTPSVATEKAEATSSSSAASGSSAATMAPFVMPSEIGKGLQAAQDHLQSVSGNPLYFSSSSDALGLSRLQINDSNWHVCSQSPAAGTMVTDATNVTFSAAKLDEPCP